MHRAAHGLDDRPVVTYSEPVSMSRETTFERDLHVRHDKAALGAIFTRLCEQVAGDLQLKGYVGRTIGIKLRFDDFRSVTRDLTLPAPTAQAEAIRRAGGLCLKRVDLGRRLRLLGVRVGGLSKASARPAAKAGSPASAPAQAPTPQTLPLFPDDDAAVT
jgi:DNA polymerase-4